ncbi:uncharacterized protein CELE_ZC404.15 [Caenorhabditis elegans]|uniref:Uncharacterized protein n=1 Tax=Caenorhabditis elegans TaxID=6239 RepID=D2KT80_CAEEL|nr:Uncharacterized protein CELE_ZC404.15 [Caenorhabditis elegans]CCD72501.1 Uncharacterized protein CELE_ZC404.15 [Caenorhabditis elegans]|eukprot:NP_001256070.1 Uncharacterized protein CELE_ZC404.15 [Caenorhabditis elegans]
MDMDTAYPVYSSMEECTAECGSLVSYCIGHMPNLVCQLNFVAFLAVIFFAIFTGIFIPVSCLFCWVSGGCRRSKSRRMSFFATLSSRQNRSRRGTGNDEERSSLYPSSPPTLQIPASTKCRQPSSFSLPAVSHDVILEESESSDHEWRKAKRCRKITFDLSMTRRDNDLSQL